MPANEKQTETLAVRGVLNRAGRFRPRRSTSTTFVRQWPKVEASDVIIELHDREGRVLLREPVLLRPRQGCDPGEAQEWNLTGYIALRDDAASVVLRRGETELWRAAVPEKPTVRVTLARKRVSRERGAALRFSYSTPGEHAFLQVIYQWGDRRHVVVAVTRPRATLDVDMENVPGGKRCRFVVQYSNGLRSAGDATPYFEVPPLGAVVTIVKPGRRTVLRPGQPLELEGHVIDPERPGGPRAAESLVWFVDGIQVGRGMIAGVDRLVPGRHRVLLRYEPPSGAPIEATASVTMEREDRNRPPADQWGDSDEWDAIERRR